MNLPDDTQRLAIIGRTGSGKTHAALWHLSLRNYDRKPWIVYDFKGDELIGEIEGSYQLAVNDPIPDQPGIYIIKTHPDDAMYIEDNMRRIWERGNTGVYVDEGYMIGNTNRWFRSLLTQGRSKHIPMIVLCQRPAWMDRFVFSESDFIQVFHIQNRKDTAKVQEFVPKDLDISGRLPRYHSYYYDVADDDMVVMKPVPDKHVLLDTFDLKLRKLRKVV